MDVSFEGLLSVGKTYSRNELAERWGYRGYQALARGVVTPKDTPFIILFVTQDKQQDFEPYIDEISGDILHWEGPNDHYAEERMMTADRRGDEVHLFYRERHHTDFVYCGKIVLVDAVRKADRPSQFKFRLTEYAW